MRCFPKNGRSPFASRPRQGAARAYDRQAQLPRLIGLWPCELEDASQAGTEKVLALLRKALRSERARGRAGHWTYDLNRHLALAECLKAEEARLDGLQRKGRHSAPAPLKRSRDANAGILHLAPAKPAEANGPRPEPK